jgi:4-hydroxybenzoate polyprenyltransferase
MQKDRYHFNMDYLRVLRPHQWLKNLILFVPLLTSNVSLDGEIIQNAFFGFFGFSLVCSANYVLNDVLDSERDKKVNYKAIQPIASGRIAKKTAYQGMCFLFLFGFTLTTICSVKFTVMSFLYAVLGFAYSKYLKNVEVVNIVTLIMFYEIRVFQGGILFDISISFWLILFSFSIFSALAFIKKYASLNSKLSSLEIKEDPEKNKEYQLYLGQFGIAFAVLSVSTFALYLNSAEVELIYKNPQYLWILVPLIQFLLLRLWNETINGRMHYDPVLFLLKDKLSLSCLTIMLSSTVILGKLN